MKALARTLCACMVGRRHRGRGIQARAVPTVLRFAVALSRGLSLVDRGADGIAVTAPIRGPWLGFGTGFVASQVCRDSGN